MSKKYPPVPSNFSKGSAENASSRASEDSMSSLSQREAQNILRLRVNRVCLVQQLNVDPVVDYLKREGILNDTDVRFISRGANRSEKTRLLLDMLPGKDPSTQWYNKFRASLSATSATDPATARNHQILTDFLDSTNLANVKPIKPSSSSSPSPQQQPPLPPIQPQDDPTSFEHRKRWKSLRSAAKIELDKTMQNQRQQLSRLPADLPEHVARTYDAWTAGGGAGRVAAKRERRCLSRLRMADEFALSSSASGKPERLMLLCFISPLHRLLCDIRRRHLVYKYLLADAPELGNAMATAFANLASGPDGRRLFTEGRWSAYAATKLANVAGRMFDFLAGACLFKESEIVARALCDYLTSFGGDCIEALLPMYRASVRLMEARLNNAQYQLADAASQTAQTVSAKIASLSFGRKVMDSQAPLQAQIGRMLLDQGSLVSALGAFSSAVSNVDLNDVEAVFKILYHALNAYIMNSDMNKAEKLAVACVRHAHKFYKAESPEYIKSLLNFVKFSNAFCQGDFGVEVAVNASLFAQLILGYQHPLLAEIQSHLSLARLLRLRNQRRRGRTPTDAQEAAAHVETSLAAVRMSASVSQHPSAASLMSNLTIAARLADPINLPDELIRTVLELGEKSVEIFTALCGQHSLATVQAKINLGRLLASLPAALGSYRQQAELAAAEALNDLTDSQPARGHVMLRAKVELAKLHRAAGNPHRALELAKEVVSLTESYGAYIRWLDQAYILAAELLSELGDSAASNKMTSLRQEWLSTHPMSRSSGLDWAALHRKPDKDFFRTFRAWGEDRKELVRQAVAVAAVAAEDQKSKESQQNENHQASQEASRTNEESKKSQRLLKLVLIGDSEVGKTCLLSRFAKQKFDESLNSIPTVGVDFSIVENQIDGVDVKCQVWDTAGQERFRTITQSYYRGCSGALLVFDATNRASFDSCDRWLSELRSSAVGSDGNAAARLPVWLVANKCDEAAELAVSREEAAEFARQRGLELRWEVSARTGRNVDEAFRSLQSRILQSVGLQSGSKVSKEKADATASAVTDKEVTKNAPNTSSSKAQENLTSEFSHDFVIKVLLIGDSGVGKSCLLRRFMDKDFDESLKATPTIGVDFRTINTEINGSKVKFQLWDTAGQERFRAISRAYFRGCSGALLVFDATNRASFDSCDRWLSELRSSAVGSDDDAAARLPVWLVANKCNEAAELAVSREEAAEFARQRGLELRWEVSARTGRNVDEAFRSFHAACVSAHQLKLQATSSNSSGANYSNLPIKLLASADELSATNFDSKILSRLNQAEMTDADAGALSEAAPATDLEKRPAVLINVIVVGNSGVGKSSLLARFAGGQFSEDYKPTVEARLQSRLVKVDGVPVQCQIWDTAGQERYRNLSAGYYSGCQCAMLVYDVTDAESLRDCESWLRRLRPAADGSGGGDLVGLPAAAPIALIGNKLDRRRPPDLSPSGATDSGSETGLALARRHGLVWREATALDSESATEAFLSLLRAVLQAMSPPSRSYRQLGADSKKRGAKPDRRQKKQKTRQTGNQEALQASMGTIGAATAALTELPPAADDEMKEEVWTSDSSLSSSCSSVASAD